MGTSYPIARKNGTTLTVNEAGNGFDIELETVEEWGHDYKMLGRLSYVLSYWDDNEDPWHPTRSAYEGGTLKVDDDPDGPRFW